MTTTTNEVQFLFIYIFMFFSSQKVKYYFFLFCVAQFDLELIFTKQAENDLKIAIISSIAKNKVCSTHSSWHDSRNIDMHSNLSTIDNFQEFYETRFHVLLEGGNNMTNQKFEVLNN